jgi:UDP-glucose 4-epimerase
MSDSILVTGAAGFLGSHMCDRLLSEGRRVVGLDNLETGILKNLEMARSNPRFTFVEGDCGSITDAMNALKGCDEVYHLAANSDVRAGCSDTIKDFRSNATVTRNLLEAARLAGNVTRFVFASSSTVYGEPLSVPTPETYGPLKPISLYGASKLFCEGWVSAYSSLFGLKSRIFRLANVVGPRLGHGIVFDLVTSLKRNVGSLEIAGDGKQTKSYVSVHDCLNGILAGCDWYESDVEIFNVGSEDNIDVHSIVDIVEEEMKFPVRAERVFRRAGSDGRGWNGDVKKMQLDIGKLKSKGWMPIMSSSEAIRASVGWFSVDA